MQRQPLSPQQLNPLKFPEHWSLRVVAVRSAVAWRTGAAGVAALPEGSIIQPQEARVLAFGKEEGKDNNVSLVLLSGAVSRPLFLPVAHRGFCRLRKTDQ